MRFIERLDAVTVFAFLKSKELPVSRRHDILLRSAVVLKYQGHLIFRRPVEHVDAHLARARCLGTLLLDRHDGGGCIDKRRGGIDHYVDRFGHFLVVVGGNDVDLPIADIAFGKLHIASDVSL